MPTRGKTTVKRKTPAARTDVTAIAAEAKRVLGWDPRITIYEADEKKLKEIQADPLFTPQHTELVKQLTFGGYHLKEIGALANPVTHANRRIVKLMPVTGNS